MEHNHTYAVVLITVPTEEVGVEIAQALLEQKLAACTNIIRGLRSIYLWEGKVSDDNEVLLLVKTRADLFEEKLVPAVKAIHPYEVPEIIALPIVMGTKEYLGWVEENVKRET